MKHVRVRSAKDRDYTGMKLANLFTCVSALAACTPAWGRVFSGSAMDGMEEAANFQIEQMQRMRSFLGPPEPSAQSTNEKRATSLPFRNPKAHQFFVDGTKLPLGMSR